MIKSRLLAEWARDNSNFRRVLFTSPEKQWVLMSIPAGGEVGTETHKNVEQTFVFVSGSARALIDDNDPAVMRPGMTVTVFPGTTHNFVNTGKKPLKLYTIYEPPNHIDGRIQATKKDADKDKADEAFGRRVERAKRRRR